MKQGSLKAILGKCLFETMSVVALPSVRACIFIEAVTASMHNPGKGVRSRFTVNAFFMLKLKIAFFSQNLLTYSRQD